jgi:N-acetylneuraminate synthase
VAEIGINHNGSIDLARDLIKAAALAGCNAVKLQKRTVDLVYTPEQLARPRATPFGCTNRDLKLGLELPLDAWRDLKTLAEHLGLNLFASCWDVRSVYDLSELRPTVYKVSSPSLTNDALLTNIRAQGVPVIMSVGMSTLDEIDHAVDVLGRRDLILLHCVSAYPTSMKDVNLSAIQSLQQRYPDVLIGYSGHELGILPSYGAVALGACVIERHLTLSRQLWGSDQAFSLEPQEMRELVEGVHLIARARGDGKLGMQACELAAKKNLRG